jgi:hypothetical protein
VCLEVPDGHFSSIAAMAARGNKLVVHVVFVLDEVLHGGRDFVVENVFAGDDS